MATWIKDNGDEIELNDEEATEEKAKELDWNKKVKKAIKEVLDKPVGDNDEKKGDTNK